MSDRPKRTVRHLPAVPKDDNLERGSAAVPKDRAEMSDLQQYAAHGVLI